MFKTEVELAAVVKKHLEKQGWDVYPEVELYSGGPRCDLVALKGEKLWAIECKLQISKAALKQTARWKRFANLLSLASSHVTFEDHDWYAREHELGIMRVFWDNVCLDSTAPYYRPMINTQLLEACREDHKELGQAGAKSKYYTPYLKLLKSISEEAHREHGQRLEDIVDSLPPHGFFIERIKDSAKNGKIEDCKLWHRNHKDYLYPIGFGPHGKIVPRKEAKLKDEQ